MHDFSPKLLAYEFNTMIDAKFEDQAWHPLRVRASTLKRYMLKTHESVIPRTAWEIDNGLDFQLHPDEKSYFMNSILSARPTVSYRVFLYAVCSEGFSIDRESLRCADTLNSQDFRMIALRSHTRTFEYISCFRSYLHSIHILDKQSSLLYIRFKLLLNINIAFDTT